MTEQDAAILGHDAGTTLVELIVYGVLTAMLLGILATIFATGLSSGAATTERDQATGRAQLIANSLQTSIRNSADFRVDGTALRAKVATGASGWRCEAWALSPAGALMHESSPSAIALPTDYAGWAELASGVTGTGAGAQPFAKSGPSLSFSLTITTGESAVPLTGGALAQAAQQGATTTCW